MKISEKFEHQIRRIHELIEQPGATVTWNDRIPDPDNPSQPRQIDITVLKENQLTIIECRIHNKPQDVKWIEELIGRRLSLRAQGVIAVSASGFTDGAIKKAKEFGVVLRHFISLTKGEILSWGKSSKVTLIFYQFKNVGITFKVPSDNVKSSLVDEIMHHLQSDEINLYGLFELISNKLEFKDIKDKIAHVKAEVSLKKKITIENMILENVIFEAEVSLLYKEVSVPSVLIYNSPNDDSLRRNVAIEGVDLGNFEITQAGDDVTITLDLSTVESPPNSLFRIVDLEFTRKVHFKKTEILGIPKMKMFLSQLSLGIQLSA
jgi:hypothetical protein